MTTGLVLTMLLAGAADSPALPPAVWSADEIEREERFIAALEARGLHDLLIQSHQRDLTRSDQPRWRRNWLRVRLIAVLERRTGEAGAAQRTARLAQATDAEKRLHADNRPPDRDENYYVTIAYLARVRGERRARAAAAAPDEKALAEAARAQLRAVLDAVQQFRAVVGERGAPPVPSASSPRARRRAYLAQRAALEEGLALFALADLSGKDEGARNQALARTERAFSRTLAAAPVSTRRGLEAALGKAAVLRARGHLENALDLLNQVKSVDIPHAARRRVRYELALTLMQAGELTKAVKATEAFLAREPPAGEPDELVLRVRLLQVGAHLRLAGQTGSDEQVRAGLSLARDLAAQTPRARVEVLDLLAIWNRRNPHLARADPLVQFARGDALYRRGKCAEAVEAFEAFGSLPDSPERRRLLPEYWYALGASHFRTKAYRKSGACFERLAADFPRTDRAPEFAYNATVAYENAYRVDGGREDLDAYLRSLRHYIAQYPGHGRVASSRWRLAEALLRDARDWTAAARAFDRIPTSDPNHWIAVLKIAESHERRLTGLMKGGQEGRAEAAAHVPTTVEALKRFSGLVLARQAWPDERTRARARREAARARMRQAQVLMSPAGQRPGPAVLALERFEQEFPDQKDLFPRVEALRLQARILAERYADADRQLARILKTFPSHLDTLRGLKGVEQRLNENLAAAGDEPSRATALHQRLARLYGYFVTWLSAQPGDHRTYVYDYTFKQADHLRRAGRYAEALPILEQLERRNPDLGNVVEALADCYERAGRYDDAVGRYRRLVQDQKRGSPAWFEAQHKVALMHLKRGDPKAGLRLIRILREGWPAFGTPEIRRTFLLLERQLEAARR